jgi:hypothetical protein
MPIHAIEKIYSGQTEIGIRLVGIGVDGLLEFLYADIPGQSWTAPRIALAEQYVQDNIDVRIARSTLDPSDPMIVAGDPGLLWLFWDGTDVVIRLMTFSDLTFDGEVSTFTLTKHSRRGWGE